MNNNKIKKMLFIICTVLLAFGSIVSAQSDLRIKKKFRMNSTYLPVQIKNPQTGEMMNPGKMPDTIFFIKGSRMLTEIRHEPKGGKKTIISKLRQCDLGRGLIYNNKSKKYTATYFSSSPEAAVKNKSEARETGGTLTLKPSPDACEKKSMKFETDGWYIDLPALSCPIFNTPEQLNDDGERNCSDKMVFQVNGKADNGFAVMVATTIASQVMGQQMGKIAKAKDEFTFDYQLSDLNAVVMSKAVTTAKAKEDGEDVLTPVIKQASTTVLSEIVKNKQRVL